jgi:hypothetical protein
LRKCGKFVKIFKFQKSGKIQQIWEKFEKLKNCNPGFGIQQQCLGYLWKMLLSLSHIEMMHP